MRISAVATALFLSSSFVASVALAQQPETGGGSNETQATPVQPERTAQQSDQAREQDRRSAEDTRVKPNWTTQPRDQDRMVMDRMRQEHRGRIMDDLDNRTTGGNWRQRDDDEMDRRSRNREEDRPRRRVKICFEYENGDEYCRYRD
ncbi:hypothetical protein ACFKHW_40420 (plasmid) [Bradyrhizobium lupini]|uniref:hypothetical protein n=1 Tax=Rhizobium lupini TaxID=136996 RepID=UPI00366BCF88